jgi:hypothetical protein
MLPLSPLVTVSQMFSIFAEFDSTDNHTAVCVHLAIHIFHGPWDGASQTPGDKQEDCLREIGSPVGNPSSVEDNELAGESACPTLRSRQRYSLQSRNPAPAARPMAA